MKSVLTFYACVFYLRFSIKTIIFASLERILLNTFKGICFTLSNQATVISKYHRYGHLRTKQIVGISRQFSEKTEIKSESNRNAINNVTEFAILRTALWINNLSKTSCIITRNRVKVNSWCTTWLYLASLLGQLTTGQVLISTCRMYFLYLTLISYAWLII